MGAYRAGAIEHGVLEYLLSAPGVTRSNGLLEWTTRGSAHSGELPLGCAASGCEGARLQVRFSSQRPSTIRFVYLINDVPVRRVDTNDVHNGWSPCTHMHQYVAATGTESVRPLEASEFPVVPNRPQVPERTVQECFEAFARLANVTLEEPYWTDPLEGWRP